jgi:preprotein translocase subunit SecB
MQTRPVQTRSILYRRVEITPYLNSENQLDIELGAVNLDWNGVRLEVATGTSIAEEGADDPANFLVSLRLVVQNQQGKICPYQLHLELLGLIQVNPQLPPERREDLATVNGLAIVYGAARELVTLLTCRMEYGPLTLPGVNFQDQAVTGKTSTDASGAPISPLTNLV